MIARARLYEQLDQLEVDLKEKLIPHLQRAVNGDSKLIFCVRDFNQKTEYKKMTDAHTEDLISIGRQILTLKKKLGESSENTIAEKICWYCRKWGEDPKSNQQTTQVLAKQFLKEIM